MEIKREGEMWLAPQKVAAAFLGVSVVAFQRWNYEPVRKEGRAKLYDVRAILNDLEDLRDESEEELDLTAERARLAKEQADRTEMENKVRRGELVEVQVVARVVGDEITAAKTRLMGIPSEISRYLEHQEAENIETQLSDAIHDALTELTEKPFGDVATPKKANGKSVERRGKAAKQGGKRATG